MLGMVYFAPDNSTYNTDDYFTVLYNELASLPDNVDILICGDFNSRTSSYTDYIEPEAQTGSDGGLSQFLPNDAHQTSDIFYEYLRNIGALYRISKDTGRPNSYGKQLLSFCKSTNIFIVNGRIGRWIHSNWYDRQKCRWLPVSKPRCILVIKYFFVHPKLPESDQMPVCVNIACKTVLDHGSCNEHHSRWYPHYKYCWDKENVKNLVNTLTDDLSSSHYAAYKCSIANLEGVDVATSNFCKFINQACQRTFDLKEINVRKRHGVRPAWFDQECRRKRAEAVKAGERAITDAQISNLMDICGEYRALK